MPLTMTGNVSSMAVSRREPLPGYTMRSVTRADSDALGPLYFASYPAGVAGATVDDAAEDIRAGFDGLYGELWLDASFVAEHQGSIVGATQIVRSAPWDDVPPGPFIIELFIHPRHRRRGLARELLARSLISTLAADESSVALRVDSENTAAVTLYQTMGFTTSAAD